MKKLLLILSAIIYIALSPHPLSAQKYIMSFDTNASQHPTIKGQLQSDFTFNDDYTIEFPTTAPTNNNGTIANYTNTNYSGIKQFETDDLILSFDYSDCLFKNATANSQNVGWKFTSILKSVTSTYLDVAIMPGTKFTIALKDSSKKIKKINICVPVTYQASLNATKFNSNLALSESAKDKYSMNLVTSFKIPDTNITTKGISLESKSLFGESSPVTVCINKNSTSTVTAASSDIITEASVNTTSNTIPKIQAFSIYYIEVEYFEGEAPEHTLNLSGSADNVLHWNTESSKWEFPSEIKFYGDLEKFKLGDLITEIARTENSDELVATAMIDRETGCLGVMNNMKFRTYADESFNIDNETPQVYSLTYYHKTTPNSFNKQVNGTSSSSNTDAYLKTYFASSYRNLTSSTPRVTAPEIFVLDYMSGLKDEWITASTTQTSGVIKMGYTPAFSFDNVKILIASTTDNHTTVPGPTLTPETGYAVNTYGSCLFDKESITVTPSIAQEGFEDSEIYYCKTQDSTPVFDKTRLTKVEGDITIDSECLLYAYAVKTIDGIEHVSAPAMIKFTKINPVKIDSYADLLNPENDGKIISLNFVTKNIAAGQIYISSTTTPGIEKKYIAHLIDSENNPIKVECITTGSDNTSPLPSFITQTTSNSYNTWATNTFINKEWLVGRLKIVNGHPIITISDLVGAEQFNFKQYNSTSAALAPAAAGVTLADFQNILTTSEIKPTHWGKRVILTHLKGFDKENLSAKEIGGNTVELAYGTSPLTIGNHWGGYSNTFNKENYLETDDEFAVHGIVDYDEGKGIYFVRVLGVDYVPYKPNIASVDDLESVTPEEGIDQTFEGVLSSGTLILKANRINEASKLATAYYYVYDYNDPNHKALGNFVAVSKTGVANITLTNAKPTFVDGYAKLAIVSSTSNKAYDGTAVVATGDTLFVTLHDYLSTAEEFTSITDFASAFKNRNETDITENSYVKITSPNRPGEFVITGYNKNYIAVRDTADMDGRNVILLYVSTPDGFEEKSSSNKFLFKEYYKVPNNNSTYEHQLRIGDALQYFTGKPKFIDGNWIIDVTGLYAASHFYGGGGNTVLLSSSDDSYYLDLIEDKAQTETFVEPEKAVITTAHINKLIILQGVTIATNNESIASLDEVDSNIQTNEVFYGITATPLPLSWDYMTTAENAESQKSIIKNATADEKFTIQGIVMSNGNGGIKLEVLDLSIAPEMLYVCNHELHESYHSNHEFKTDLANKLVGASGVKIKKTGDVYELVLKLPVALNWTDDKAVQKVTDINSITANIPTDADITSIEYEITGFLRIADDGKQTIDVMNFKPIVQSTRKFQVVANAGGVTGNTFHSFSIPYITAVTNGGIPTEGAENYRFFYRMAKAPADEVRARLKTVLNPDGEDIEIIMADYIEEAEEKLYDRETIEPQTENYFFQAYSCTPGKINPIISTYVYMENSSKEVATLDDVINGSYSYANVMHLGTSTPNAYFINNPMRVVGLNPEYGYMAVTDGTKVIGVRLNRSIAEDLAVGDYLNPFGIQRWHHNHVYNFLDSHVYDLKLASAPSTSVEIPEAIELTDDLAAHKGQLVKVTAAKISRASTTPSTEPVALVDDATTNDGEWVLTTTINNSEITLPITSHIGWTPDGLSEDDDNEFIVKGIVMPRTSLIDPNADKVYDGQGNIVEPKADATQHELWATSVEVRRRTATPVFALVGQETNEDGVAVATETVTVTITSEEGAAIEYSLDGGTTWLPYTAPLAVDKSAQISARAVLGDYRESKVAQQTIRFEYYSGDVRITVSDPMPGYTEVRMTPADASLAEGSYTIRYTTDGSEPTATSTAYTAPLELESATTIKAALFENAKERQGKTAQQTVSTIKSGNVKVSVVNDDKGTHVVLSPESNKHLASHFDIFYAFEGGDGTWTRYSAFIHIDENSKIMAYMVESDKTDGDIVTLAVTGISKVGVDDTASVSVEGDSIVAPEGSQVFDLTGRRVRPEGLRAGIYIVRLPGGKAVKVAVK